MKRKFVDATGITLNEAYGIMPPALWPPNITEALRQAKAEAEEEEALPQHDGNGSVYGAAGVESPESPDTAQTGMRACVSSNLERNLERLFRAEF